MDIWKHGKYIDMWSTVHFLSGYSLFLIFNIIGYDLLHSMIISVSLLILWEFFEWITDIIEPSLNVMTDIIVGFLGFSLGWFLHYFLDQQFDVIYLGFIIVVTLSLSLWGFLDFLKRGYR